MRMGRAGLARIAVVAILMSLVPAVSADDRGFNSLVGYLKTNYGAKRQGSFGMVTFARFFVKVVKPAGVKDFKLSMLRELDYSREPRPEAGSFHTFVHGVLSKDWQPLVRYYSRRSNQWTYVYVQELKKDMKLLVLTMQQREAYVVQVKFSPEKLIAFMNDPKIMGISLSDKDQRNQPKRQQEMENGDERNPARGDH
ncbi:MAG TPA: hypothetical protein VJH03_12135 [Blastocatellia bacterium]|nr:hypothetical protein [Blastocatellia bacterium]